MRKTKIRKDFIEEEGNRYGRLRVQCVAQHATGDHLKWLCVCDCGNTAVVSGGKLRRGHTKSCGCLQRDKAAATMRATSIRLWKEARHERRHHCL
jgi:hypothetical protein